MTDRMRWRGWTSPPLVVQILALLIGALAVAQLVTLLLTLVLPPEPPRRYEIGDIAAALRGGSPARPLARRVQAGPPDLAARGWLVSPTTTAELARAIGVPADRVVFGFYTELPIGGPVGPPPKLPVDARPTRAGPPVALRAPARQALPLLGAVAIVPVAGMQAAPPPAGGPGGRPPGGGLPGGFPGGGFPPGGFPAGSRPDGGFGRAPLPMPRGGRGGTADVTVARDPGRPVRTGGTPTALTPDRAGPPAISGTAVQLRRDADPAAQDRPRAVAVDRPAADASPAADRAPAETALGRRDPAEAPRERPTDADRSGSVDRGPRGDRPVPLLVSRPAATPERGTDRPPPTPAARTTQVPVPAATVDPARAGAPRPAAAPAKAQPPAAALPAPGDARAPRLPTTPAAAMQRPMAIARPATGLFGLAAAPFVEGDFVAAVRGAAGRWTVVSPAAESFPNAWQRRVLLWFALSLAAVAPIAWAFARRIVGPLGAFAEAAERLGRDPSAAILPLEGPAEVGRAAHAFNQMHSRLRSFVDDRTAMIGAISHDLRTPLTRLRFRIEDVPDDQHAGLLGEIEAMEAMITSVIAYMRDAATPGVRERRDLAELVGDVVEDAALIGGDVRTVRAEPAPVDIDALGVRRVLDNLLTNAIKYGGGVARVSLGVEDACAVADIVDDGPGIPEAELERVFEPFYRSEAARASQREGSGLGLAVCRSIARAHGGDVRLFRSAQGFTARVTLPLAYDGERQLAA